MTTQQAQFTGGSFKLGYRFQRYWDTPMALAFFCGELGAGLFLMSLVLGMFEGMVAGLILTGLGKPFFHLSHMGVPARSWKAILRPDRSWVSRGLLAIVVFVGCAGLLVFDRAFGLLSAVGLQGDAAKVILAIAEALAALSGLVVMTYQGFAMAHSTAIALWSSGLMPVASLSYSLAGGASAAALIGAIWGMGSPIAASTLELATLAFTGVTLAVVLSLLHAAWYGSPGGRQSAELLLKGPYARPFLGLVLVVGLFLPMAVIFALPHGLFAWSVIAGSVLTGYLTFRILVFKAGVFEPPLNLADSILG